MGIANKMRIHGYKLNDVAIIKKILRSMAPKFDYVVCSIEDSRGRGRGNRDEDGGRGNKDEGRSSHNYKRNDDHSQNRGRGQGDKSKIECYRCGNLGHYRNECYTKLPKEKENGEISNFAEKKEEETLLMAFHAKEEPELDVRTKNDFVETILNVFYVPDLKSNLLSAGQLQDKGYVITIQEDVCEIYDPARGAIVVVQMTTNRLFPLKIKTFQACVMAKEDDSSWLWHFRYGHLNFNGLRTLHQKQMVTSLPMITPPSKICEDCIVGKQY
ncbi:uncharacterized protein LOC110770778 [Prunus avium]|uniref:Uncharacterized protein LOC110770778 n=1 Tax=Prunus avium TaxID=42229 RepID=A0A6P5TUI0_PRUAV|nr:uncharacterized protein LOC110770778 [Prunus avium]